MADFIELIGPWSFNRGLTDDDWTGHREFMQADDPSATMTPNVILESAIPDVGDAFPVQPGPTAPTSFTAKNVIVTYDGGDFTKNKRYAIDYASTDTSNENAPSDEDQVESLTISSFTRVLPLVSTVLTRRIKDANGKALKEMISLEITAQYTITIPDFATLDLASASGSPLGRVDVANANWLMMGTNVTQYRDRNGVDKFKASRSYSFKRIEGPAGRILDDSWQAQWFEDFATWGAATVLPYTTGVNVDVMPTIP